MKKVTGLIMILLLGSLFMGCGGSGQESSSSSGTTAVTLSFGSSAASAGAEFSSEAVPSDVTKITITITAADMETITEDIIMTSGETASVTLDVPNGVSRTFLVEAVDSSGNLLYTGSETVDLYGDPVTVTVTMTFPAPAGFTAIAVSDSQIDLKWDPSSAADSSVYNIYRDSQMIQTVTKTDFSDRGLASQTTYCYAVAAFDPGGTESALSEEICVTTLSPDETVQGSWGFARMGHTESDTWETEGGTRTYNPDGTAAVSFNANVDDTLFSGTDSFTYSAVTETDGSVTIAETSFAGTDAVSAVLSDDWNVMLVDGTSRIINGVEDTSVREFLPLVKLDPGRTYSDADLKGEYYFIGYKFDPLKTQYGINNSYTGVLNANGAGTFFIRQTVNFDGRVTETSADGNYTVNPDGSYIISNAGINFLSGNNGINRISGNGIFMISSNADETGSWGVFFGMKRADREYTSADIEGTWALMGFGDSVGATGMEYRSSFGTATCTSSGDCFVEIKSLEFDGSTSVNTDNTFLSVNPDGSFGTSLSFVSPNYAGAVGNNGNTILFNRSFNPLSINEREVYIGVRCSKCGNLTQ